VQPFLKQVFKAVIELLDKDQKLKIISADLLVLLLGYLVNIEHGGVSFADPRLEFTVAIFQEIVVGKGEGFKEAVLQLQSHEGGGS